eukprot:m.190452 g.190452  ORF g.190452 m.190452 type:complete len:222 (+) comp14818_c0_seq1:1343-2008(+)
MLANVNLATDLSVSRAEDTCVCVCLCVSKTQRREPHFGYARLLSDDVCLLELICFQLHYLQMLAMYGTVAIVGNRGEVTINPRMLMMKEASVVGVMRGTPVEAEQAFAYIDAGFALGTLTPVVGVRMPLSKAPDAHVEVIEHKQGSKGKIVCPHPLLYHKMLHFQPPTPTKWFNFFRSHSHNHKRSMLHPHTLHTGCSQHSVFGTVLRNSLLHVVCCTHSL